MLRARNVAAGLTMWTVFSLASQVGATTWSQWSISEGGNGHWYALTDHGTWSQANAQAVSAGGYLVVFGSAAENAWLTITFRDAYDRAYEMNPTVIPTVSCVAWIGYRKAEDAWGWENGEPVTY